MAKTTTVLAISRQFGSGGSIIGHAVAERLGMKVADREILWRAAQECGLEEHTVEQLEEKPEGFWHSFLSACSYVSPEVPYVPPPIPPVYEEHVFELERRIMRELADQFDVVIIGRAGYHVLADHPGLVSVLIHAPKPWRIQHIMQIHGRDEKSATALVETMDRQREAFIRTVTGAGSFNEMARSHDLCINTGTIGLEEATEMVIRLVSDRRQQLTRA